MRRFSFLFLALLILSSLLIPASRSEAQDATVVNPTTAKFDSLDHALITRYELAIYAVGATEPLSMFDLVTNCVVAEAGGTMACAATLPARPVPTIATKFYARVRAYGANGYATEWSEPSNEFLYTPRPPARPAVAR